MCVRFPFLGGSFLESDLSSAVLLVTSHVSETQHRRLGEVKWSQSAELPGVGQTDRSSARPPLLLPLPSSEETPSEMPVGLLWGSGCQPPVSHPRLPAFPLFLGTQAEPPLCLFAESTWNNRPTTPTTGWTHTELCV